MNRGIQWKSGINDKPLAYILISEVIAKYYTDTETYTHLVELNLCCCLVASVKALFPNCSQNGKKFPTTNQNAIFRIKWSVWLIFLQFKLPANDKQTRVQPNDFKHQNLEIGSKFTRSFASLNKQNITCR